MAYSCKERFFYPPCHTKKVIQFGELLKYNILYPVPYCQYVFSLPMLLRVYFKHDRGLLSKLCRCAYDSLLEFLPISIGLADGVPGVVMTIQTFANFLDKYHPHLHLIVSDGLFNEKGAFNVMPKVNIKRLEELFCANVFKLLKQEGKINDKLIKKLLD